MTGYRQARRSPYLVGYLTSLAVLFLLFNANWIMYLPPVHSLIHSFRARLIQVGFCIRENEIKNQIELRLSRPVRVTRVHRPPHESLTAKEVQEFIETLEVDLKTADWKITKDPSCRFHGQAFSKYSLRCKAVKFSESGGEPFVQLVCPSNCDSLQMTIKQTFPSLESYSPSSAEDELKLLLSKMEHGASATAFWTKQGDCTWDEIDSIAIADRSFAARVDRPVEIDQQSRGVAEAFLRQNGYIGLWLSCDSNSVEEGAYLIEALPISYRPESGLECGFLVGTVTTTAPAGIDWRYLLQLSLPPEYVEVSVLSAKQERLPGEAKSRFIANVWARNRAHQWEVLIFESPL